MKKFIIPLVLLITISIFASCDSKEEIFATLHSRVEQQYPGARITDNDREWQGIYEVEIYHEGRKKDVCYNRNFKWLYTKWDITILEVPVAALKSVKDEEPSWEIDDIEYVESPGGVYYEFNIENGSRERTIKVNADGVII